MEKKIDIRSGRITESLPECGILVSKYKGLPVRVGRSPVYSSLPK
jgi:hypothetical protein